MENLEKDMDNPVVFLDSDSMRGDRQEWRPEGFPGQRLVIVPAAIVEDACRRPVTRDLCITHIGHFSAASGHYVERPRGTEEHILIACLSGAGTCALGDGEWNLRAGNLLFLPPGARHVYRADPLSPWTIFWIHFRGRQARDHLANLGVNGRSPVIEVDSTTVLAETFEDTFRHATHGFGEAAMTGLSTAFARLLGLAKVHRRTVGARDRGAEGRLLKVLALMREDLARPWTLRELSHEAGMSMAHFTGLCRRQTGMPPLSLLIRLRLQHAMDLLQRGSHNVAEAARAVGYEDPFYFSRLFRKHIGVAPSSCRHGP